MQTRNWILKSSIALALLLSTFPQSANAGGGILDLCKDTCKAQYEPILSEYDGAIAMLNRAPENPAAHEAVATLEKYLRGESPQPVQPGQDPVQPQHKHAGEASAAV